MSSGITDSSLKFHLKNAKEHGVTQKRNSSDYYACCILCRLAKRLGCISFSKRSMGCEWRWFTIWRWRNEAHAREMIFPIGAPNDGYAQYFSGKSFLAPVSASQVGVFNVTFEPGCRNNWHIHHAKSGGGRYWSVQPGVVLSGRRKRSDWDETRRLHQRFGRCKALAWSSARWMVFPSCNWGTGGRNVKWMVWNRLQTIYTVN